MAEQLYGLTGGDVQTLREIVAAYRAGSLGRPTYPGRTPLGERSNVIFGVADAAIAGTSDDLSDPYCGTLNVYKFTSTGATTDQAGTTDSGRDETVYNLSTVSRTTDEYTTCVRDYESGKWIAVGGSGGIGYKKLCRFTLDAAMATSNPTGSGLLTAQYGDGTAHSTGAISLDNLLTKTASTYLFSGTSGAAGLGYYTTGTNWRIIQMECP
jgi:hypothetical protein